MYHLTECRIEDLLRGEIFLTTQVIRRKIIGLVTKGSQAIPRRMPVKLLLVFLKLNQETDSIHLRGQAIIREIGLRTDLKVQL